MNLATRRRLTFQLTPLLDLLLIVIFAQYMEVRSATRAELADADAARERARSLAAEREAAADRAARLADENLVLRAELDRAAERSERVAERFAEIFRVNGDALAAALASDDPRLRGTSDAQLARLRGQLEEFIAASGAEALEHLVTYDELRKRSDVWKVRIGTVAEGGRVTINAGNRSEVVAARSPEDFAMRLAEIRNAVEEPKGLVIILLTYDAERVELLSRNFVREGLSRFVTRTQGNETTRFFWAEIGVDPELFEGSDPLDGPEPPDRP